MNKCHCCGTQAVYSIVLAFGPDGDGNDDRVYLPNQHARKFGSSPSLRETWFCKPCMRTLEDTLRATLKSLAKLDTPGPV